MISIISMVHLGQILGVSHIQLGKLHMVNNPNNGFTTTAKEFIEGSRKMSEMVTPYIAVDFACVREDLYEDVKDVLRCAGISD